MSETRQPAATFWIPICALLAAGGSILASTSPAEDAAASAQARKQARKALAKARVQLAAGMKQVHQVTAGLLAPRQTATLQVALDGPRCYKFIAQGGQGVNDLSLTVSANGKEVAGDRISGKRPVAQWCPSENTQVEIAIKLYDGSGAYALGIYSGKAKKSRVKRVGSSDSDFVAIRIRQLHAQFGKGRAAVSSLFRGNLVAGAEQRFEVRLSANHCYTIIAAGSPEVRNLDLALLDPKGNPIERDETTNNYPTLDVDPCIKSTGQYVITVKMSGGSGKFGVQVFSN